MEIKIPSVNTTEIVFTTSFNLKARTFFCQLCKYSNEELEQFNRTIDQYCIQANEKGTDDINQANVELGDVVGSKFLGVWYRAEVVDFKKKGRVCRVKFIDYGNTADVDLASLVQFNKNEIPIIDKPPFGITYSVESARDYDEDQFKKLSECLLSNYIMLKILDRDENGGYRVFIPGCIEVGYNRAFWRSLEGGENNSEISDSS